MPSRFFSFVMIILLVQARYRVYSGGYRQICLDAIDGLFPGLMKAGTEADHQDRFFLILFHLFPISFIPISAYFPARIFKVVMEISSHHRQILRLVSVGEIILEKDLGTQAGTRRRRSRE